MYMNDSINPIFIYEGTLLRLVPHEPDNGYRLYLSFDGTIGLQISPTGVEKLLNATPTTCENCKVKSNANRKQRYLQFKHPWNTNENILVSHAVYLAWVGSIPKDTTVERSIWSYILSFSCVSFAISTSKAV